MNNRREKFFMYLLLGRAGSVKGRVYRIKEDATRLKEYFFIFLSEDGSVKIKKTKSGADLFLNGHPVVEASLKHNDEIVLDDNIFRFVINENNLIELHDGKIFLYESDRLTLFEKRMEEKENPYFNSAGSKEEFIALLYKAVQDRFSDSRSLLFLWNEASGSFEKENSLSGKETTPFHISRSVFSAVLTEQKAVLSQDILKDPRFKNSDSLHGQSIHSIMCAPIIYREKMLGILYLYSSDLSFEFSKEDFDALCRICRESALVLEKLLSIERLANENRWLRENLKSKNAFIGKSDPVKKIFSLIERVAPTDLSVLIRGETGTGKERVAHLIHESSPRKEYPLVCVNCSALNESLLESELFGHEKGAFTDAKETKIGKFEQPDGGTIFLDEIGDIPLKVQVKLLRFLQEREFERVGGTKKIKVNVRIITATNRDLEKLIKEGNFREDLYYRLKAFQIHLPPLRDRKDDIEDLAFYFINRFTEDHNQGKRTITQEALTDLKKYSWPGNVREFKNTIEQALVLSSDRLLDKDHFFLEEETKENQNASEPRASADKKFKEAQEEFERSYFHQLLTQLKGRVSIVSKESGLERTYLHSKLKKLGMDPQDYR